MSAWKDWTPPELSELTKRVMGGLAAGIAITWVIYWLVPMLSQPVVVCATVTVIP